MLLLTLLLLLLLLARYANVLLLLLVTVTEWQGIKLLALADDAEEGHSAVAARDHPAAVATVPAGAPACCKRR